MSSIDYTNLQAWANALPATLTAAVAAQVWNNGSITTTSGVPFLTLTGHTTTPTNSISIYPAPGEGFITTVTGDIDPFSATFSTALGAGYETSTTALAFNAANGVNFICPATGTGNINYFQIQDNYVTLQELQFQDPNANSVSTILQPTQNCTIAQCIFDGYGQPGGAAIIAPLLSGASTCVVNLQNCLIVDRASNSGTGITIEANYNFVSANNTIVLLNASPTQGGIVNTTAASGVTFRVINTIMIGYAQSYVLSAATTGTITESYGVFSASLLTGSGVTAGAGNIYGATAAGTFISATANFRLLSTASAINAGFTDTTDIPAAVDIIGTTRPQGTNWDIGAYEYAQVLGSIGGGGGHASGQAVSALLAVGTGGGHASGLAVSGQTNVAIGTGGGQASGLAVSGQTNFSIGTGGGRASGTAYSIESAIEVSITLNPIGSQTVNVPFQASGTYTLTPTLLFADDTATAFTPIPLSGVSPIGSAVFDFVHPGIAAVGQHNLLVEDLVTNQEAAQNYTVLASPPPPSTGPAPAAAFQTGALTSLSQIIPAYVYQQYADDDNIQAFFASYNNLAQIYLNWFNAINLPVYTGPLIVGPLLDWVAQGIYGISRPTIALTQTLSTQGDFNTYNLNTIDFNGSGAARTSQLFTVTDDIYKRILTWTLYRGDGREFNVIWLKRRVARFLAGVNGTDYTGPTDQIGIGFTGLSTVTITITNGVIPLTVAPIFQAAVLDGTLPLPFQFSFNVLITAAPVTAPTSSELAFNLATNSQYLPAWGF